MRCIEAQQIENLFAGNIRQLLMEANLDYDKLYEIRLRVGRPLFLTYDGGECFLRSHGQDAVCCDAGGSDRNAGVCDRIFPVCI